MPREAALATERARRPRRSAAKRGTNEGAPMWRCREDSKARNLQHNQDDERLRKPRHSTVSERLTLFMFAGITGSFYTSIIYIINNKHSATGYLLDNYIHVCQM